MAEWLNAQLKQLGVDTQLVDLGRHTMDGEDLPLPPAILGQIGNDKSKKTVLIYGHFDVQPVRQILAHYAVISHIDFGSYRQTSRTDGILILSN